MGFCGHVETRSHVVAAGVDELQYIEPYPKSQALKLHDDSIGVDATNWQRPSAKGKQVLFRPFRGVAPRMYSRAFVKDRDLKDDGTGVMSIGEPEWGFELRPHTRRVRGGRSVAVTRWGRTWLTPPSPRISAW